MTHQTINAGVLLDRALDSLLTSPPTDLEPEQRAQVGLAQQEVRTLIDRTQPGEANPDSLGSIMSRLAPILGPALMAFLIQRLTTTRTSAVPTSPGDSDPAGDPLTDILGRILTGGGRGGGGGSPLDDLLGSLIGGGSSGAGRAAPAQPASGDPLSDLLGSLIGGQGGSGAGQQGRSQQGRSIEIPMQPRQEPGGGSEGDALSDLFKRIIGMAESGTLQEAQRPEAPLHSERTREDEGRSHSSDRSSPSAAQSSSGGELFDQLDSLFGDGPKG